ncbi:MAG: MauE/DoxX family redox-associated membrane protein [Spirochaetia bacterium]|jgi:uncharacterized membrane protein YphA (DoxX/SURF4 family)
MQPARNSSRSFLPWVGLAIRLLSAAFWILSGAMKLPDLGAFADQVDRYEVLPRFLVAPLAYIMPFFEIFLGLYLAAGLFVRVSALVGTILLAVFLAAQVQALIRGLVLDCGCFGSIFSATVSPGTIFRDLALGLPTFLMAAFPARRFSLDRQLFDAADRFAL